MECELWVQWLYPALKLNCVTVFKGLFSQWKPVQVNAYKQNSRESISSHLLTSVGWGQKSVEKISHDLYPMDRASEAEFNLGPNPKVACLYTLLRVIVSSQFVKLRDHGSLVIKVLHFIRLVKDYIPLVWLHNVSRGAVQRLTPTSFQSWGRTVFSIGVTIENLTKYHCTKLASVYKGTIQEACGHF